MKIIKFFRRNYWILLLLTVLISYGQILFMQPWQDDNALFFKLANIKEPAGYLGRGLFGEGPYKYTAFFYYPLYKIFGFNTYAFFSESLIFYFLAALCIYKLFSEIISKPAGRVAGTLFAAGYVAAD